MLGKDSPLQPRSPLPLALPSPCLSNLFMCIFHGFIIKFSLLYFRPTHAPSPHPPQNTYIRAALCTDKLICGRTALPVILELIRKAPSQTLSPISMAPRPLPLPTQDHTS
jgi:hypothetical protein